jgi:hypothetical protein
MKIPEEIAIDFNNKVNTLRRELMDMRPYCKSEIANDILREQINRLEIARRIFNDYALNGVVRIPE